ncbi:MAG TPA: peptidoglycan DD-metalloendopeptidase family protein [Bacteroidales bacterium]|nr:peptidoglycan DD-metalloendopeptidase family protein [Bacteroidales bacterium]HNR40982.1 peptidoglycan DD-metalloendopeptidase family protein [Bacteroidales bacterium]HPM18155.1 peptidoglycan DD-metalloendopeptidase family protein [Bacteroidales bacterium]HQG78406.1 peptidoglycan DD-metalloendopeptidase family protein [Bacteroidales bacterium]
MTKLSVLWKIRLVIVMIIIAQLTVSCSKSGQKDDETPPVLSVTPVDITTVTHIIPFGADLSPQQKNPAFEYYVSNSSVQVRSVCAGYVEDIRLNDNFPDYEVWIKTSSNSVYKLIYDHIVDLNVVKGNKVDAGTVLGKVGKGNRTELQINKSDRNMGELSYCPFDFATDDFISSHKQFTDTWCLTGTVRP